VFGAGWAGDLVTLAEHGGSSRGQSRPCDMAEDGRARSCCSTPTRLCRRVGPTACWRPFDASVASVTPFSNTAEIFSAPAGRAIGRDDGGWPTGSMRGADPRPATDVPSAPTGVGFCMALSRRWLARVPRLDPAFGRGYGEEVDWCQRSARWAGGMWASRGCSSCMRAARVSGRRRRACLATANAMLSRRYPRYDAEVQDFSINDPLRTARLALPSPGPHSVSGPLPVYLAHSLGGGADMALEREIARDLRHDRGGGRLRVGGVSRFAWNCMPTGVSTGRQLRSASPVAAGRRAAAADRLFLRRRRSRMQRSLPGLLLQLAARRAARSVRGAPA
jgi:hypothetical protein